MGVSYCCKKCGPKAQYDWMPSCVVEIPKLGHVKGHYDGECNVVNVKVQGKEEPVEFCPSQFQEYVDVDGVLPATDIYCNGDEAGSDTDKLMMLMLKGSMKGMQAMIGGAAEDFGLGEDESPRFCVPKDIVVLDELTAEQHAKLVADNTAAKSKKPAAVNKKKASEEEGGKKKKATATKAKKRGAVDKKGANEEGGKKKTSKAAKVAKKGN